MKRRPEYNLAETGKNLRRLREQKNLSAEDVRSYMGLESVQAVYRWEKGYNFPTADNLLALAELYGVNPLRMLVKKISNVHFIGEEIALWDVDGMDYHIYI